MILTRQQFRDSLREGLTHTLWNQGTRPMNDTPTPPENNEGPDLNKLFDLDRKALTGSMVSNIEHAMRDIDSSREDLGQILLSCKERGYSAREIAAMKAIAKMRKDDKVGEAQEKLEALHRVSRSVGIDLFQWADTQPQ